MAVLVPIGTKVCTWGERFPSQPDGNAHLNVNESMSAPTSASYVAISQPVTPGLLFEVLLGEVDFEGEFESLEQEFRYSGLDDLGAPTAATFDVLLDGQSVVVPKGARMNTDGALVDGQLTWVEGEFLAGLTGARWNAATERTMQCTSTDFAGDDPPDPWAEG